MIFSYYQKETSLNFFGINTYIKTFKTRNFIKKDTLAQVFFWEFCEISKNTFFIEHLWWLLLWVGRLQNVCDKSKEKTPNHWL